MVATVKDSGNRRTFSSGAVRDIQEGKGRCDLLPVGVCASLMDIRQIADCLCYIDEFMHDNHDEHLYHAIREFCEYVGWDICTCLLECSIHYEDGANKYGERNWEKGIELHSFIDSGIRHLLKFVRGDVDEPHDRAFVWNMLGAIWTNKYRHDLCDIDLSEINKDADFSDDLNYSGTDQTDLIAGQMYIPKF